MVIAHELDASGFFSISLLLSQQHHFYSPQSVIFTCSRRDWDHYNYNITDVEYQGKTVNPVAVCGFNGNVSYNIQRAFEENSFSSMMA